MPIMLFFMNNSYAQNQASSVLNIPVKYHKIQDTSEDIQLAGMYMEKAANHYKISRILFIAAALTPLIFRVIRSADSESRGLTPVLASSAMGLTGLGFGFSGDINLKKGSGILRRIDIN